MSIALTHKLLYPIGAMRILFVADGRSLNTRGWLNALSEADQDIHLVSTYAHPDLPFIASQTVLPIAFSRLARPGRSKVESNRRASTAPSADQSPRSIARLRPLLMRIRYVLGPLSLRFHLKRLIRIIDQVNPDLLHALRIPFEGMFARYAAQKLPVVVSIWGNDLTLHANGSFFMRTHTRQTLLMCAGLIADAGRDIELARQWGLPDDTPTTVLPGAGGIPTDVYSLASSSIADVLNSPIQDDAPVILNPRGFRTGSVRNDIFFQAIPIVLAEIPDAVFLCPAMADEPEAADWVQRLGIQAHVQLLPKIPHERMVDVYKRAQITVSISEHDGTPNSMLEAMASGSYPVVGDIASVREWVTHNQNGLLVDPADPGELAQALINALRDRSARDHAAEQNKEIINTRADQAIVIQKALRFYRGVLNQQ